MPARRATEPRPHHLMAVDLQYIVKRVAYMTANEIAERLNVRRCRVLAACRELRIKPVSDGKGKAKDLLTRFAELYRRKPERKPRRKWRAINLPSYWPGR
jgi:hypothetical protein